jgi:hypothetical protein
MQLLQLLALPFMIPAEVWKVIGIVVALVVAVLIIAGLNSGKKRIAKESEPSEPPSPKSAEELLAEKQRRDELARQQAERDRERQEEWWRARREQERAIEASRREISRQADEARSDGYVVCTECLPDRLTIICKKSNSSGESICANCKQLQEDYDEEQRRNNDD